MNEPDVFHGTAEQHNSRRADLIIVGLFAALLVVMVLSLTLGRYPVPIEQILRVILTTPPKTAFDFTDTYRVVVEIVRLPRILGVTLCGMGLSLAGAAMQGVFRNPLASPEIVGVSAGASFGGVLAFVLAWPMTGVVSMGFGFGMGALLIALALAKLAGKSSMLALILSGVIVGGFFGSLTGFAEYVANPETRLPSIMYWLLGSFVGLTYAQVAILAGVILFAGTMLLMLRWRINLLSLGEVDAQVLGVNIEALRWIIIALASLIVAAQVSVSGVIGWVGLIIPHFARMLVGPEHSRLMPASALLGGIYLLAMDDIARSVTVQEIPIGLLTALVGTPIFAFLFWETQGRGWGRE